MKMMLQKQFVAAAACLPASCHTGGRGRGRDAAWNWKRRIVDVTFIFDRVVVAISSRLVVAVVVPGASQLN